MGKLPGQALFRIPIVKEDFQMNWVLFVGNDKDLTKKAWIPIFLQHSRHSS